MKKSTLLVLVIQFISLLINAQAKTPSVKWTVSPFDFKVFVENQGQFDGALPDNQVIYYQATLGKVTAYFTPNGVVYAMPVMPTLNGTPLKKDDGKDKDVKPMMHYLYATWNGALKKPVLTADGKQSYFYAYPKGTNATTTASVYKRITYANIYPGIDAVYTFPDKKSGIKYSLIVHPGADISKVQMAYTGATKTMKDEEGNIVITSDLGDITDHAPVSYDQSGKAVETEYTLTGPYETFKVGSAYDKTKTLTIDPWTTGTSFAGINAAFDLDYDKYGNVYAFGGLVSSTTLQLVKITSTGVKQWVFNASAISGISPDSYGDIATDKKSGTTYIVQGYGSAIVLKVNSAGALVTTFPGSTIVDEFWRADFDMCNHQIVIGAGGTGNPYQAALLDTNCTTLTPVNIFGVGEAFHDITLMCLYPYSNSCFMCSAKNTIDTLAANKLAKMPLPSLTPTAFMVGDGFGFNEVASIPYAGNQSWDNANAMNGAAASPNWVYLYNGDTLKQFFKTTGKLNAKVGLSTVPFQSGGLDVDACDNIYVGSANSIKIFNSALVLQSTVTLPDSVYDVHLGPNNSLFACGMGFISEMTVPGGKNVITTITYPTTCSACNGKATANPGCGKAPFTYLWSNGETGQTDTGLCSGIYTVTVNDASCPPNTDTAIVDVSGKAGYLASVVDTNPTCFKPKGSLTVFPVGGVSPYTYLWSNGETTQEDTGLAPGIYNCVISDNTGCKYTVSETLVFPVPPYISIFPPIDSVCNGAIVPLTALGGKTYTWSPSIGLSCTNCPNPIATVTVNTTYTVIGIDSLGCVGRDSVLIAFSPPPTISVTVIPDGCFGTILEATGASSFTWFPGTGLSCTNCSFNVATDTAAVTYTVVGSQHGCNDTATVTVPAIIGPSISVVASKDTICSGDSVKLTATVSSGLLSFSWYPTTGVTCSTCTVTYVHPTVTTSYEAYGFDSSGCSAFAFVTIVVNGIGATATTFGCGGPTFLEAFGSSSTYTWVPATGLSCTNCEFPTATPTVTTTYTVYGTSLSACPGADSAVITVVPSTVPTVSVTVSKDTICIGDSTFLSGSGKGITTYEWFPTTAVSCYLCQSTYAYPTVTTTYTLYGFDSLGCLADTMFTIVVKPKLKVKDSINTCAGIIKLGAVGATSYTWAPASSLSASTGQIVIATPTVVTTYTVTGGGVACSGGDTATITITPLPPLATVTLAALPDTVSCPGDSAKLIATGKNVSTYTWFPSTGVGCDACSTTNVLVTGTVTYTMYVTNSAGCTVSASVTLHAANGKNGTQEHYICPDNSVTLNASGGTSYTWSTGVHTTSIVVAPAVTTSYSVAIKQGGCQDTLTHVVNVNSIPVGSVCCDATITSGQSVTLTATGGSSYVWSPATGLSCVSCSSPVASPSVTTTYYMTVTSDSGCVSRDSLVIIVKENCTSGFDVPNVFTPNGDNVNDFLMIDASGLSTYAIEIFDRWGVEVFNSNNPADPWNGKVKNDGTEVPDGVYYYIIKGTCNSVNFDKKGFVQVIR